MLVTQQKDATRSEFQAFAKSKGASDLMVPAEVVVLDKLPVLGTGKIDMVGVAKLVKERAAAMPGAGGGGGCDRAPLHARAKAGMRRISARSTGSPLRAWDERSELSTR